jgi:hypothetical protein
VDRPICPKDGGKPGVAAAVEATTGTGNRSASGVGSVEGAVRIVADWSGKNPPPLHESPLTREKPDDRRPMCFAVMFPMPEAGYATQKNSP